MAEHRPFHSVEEFAAEVARTSRRVADLRQRASAGPLDATRVLEDATTELLTATESLHVAEEELRVQNEELTHAHEALQEERRQYQELFDFAPDVYLVTDHAGTIRRANLAAGSLLGVERRFLHGKPLAAFVDEGSRRVFRRQLDLLCGVGSTPEWGVTLRPRFGAPITVGVRAAVMHERGEAAAGLLWILRDRGARVAELEAELAREREARTAAAEASEAKSALLAALSHEFRTPLQAIAGYSAVLALDIHGVLSDAQREDVRRIQQSEEHLLDLVNGILDLAKLESGRTAPMLRDVPVREALAPLRALIAPQVEAKGLRFEERGDPAVTVRADRLHLERIVLNLLSNAVKFTGRGGAVTLEWTAEATQVYVRVRDTGCGIPADQLQAVFEPFVQGPALGPAQGTGLGLSISRDLARLMGGDLTAESVLGEGSIFSLRLPAGNMR